MSEYIKLKASIQTNIKVIAQQLKDEGNEDLAILLELCSEHLDTKREFVKNSMKLIAEEADQRKRLQICPQCKAVMRPEKPCEKCGATLNITAP